MELRVEHLCKAYEGVRVLQNVTFTVGNGVTCIMAPSGTGKTTLLRILLGLEKADSGSVTRCRWSAVFQEDRLLPHLNAMENQQRMHCWNGCIWPIPAKKTSATFPAA